MSLVIKNASLLLGKSLKYVDTGFVEVTRDGIIERADTARYKREDSHKVSNIIDAEGFLVIPGFINAHTHIGDSIGKDLAIDCGLNAVHPIRGTKKKILEKSNPGHLRVLMRASAISMMRNGITTFVDFREGGVEGVTLLKNAIFDLPIKCLILGRIEYYFDIKSISEHGNKNVPRIKKSKLPDSELERASNLLRISQGFGISGANENTDWSLRQYNELVNKHSRSNGLKNKTNTSLLGIHAAESKSTAEFSILRTGKTEVYRIITYLKPNFVVHMTQATDEDISLVAKNDVGVIVCPRANGVLGCGIPRISQMIKNGCKVAIGTDNVMINSPDIFREMDYVWKTSRSYGINLSAKNVLKMATVNGSEILNLNSGYIKAGRSADLIFLDKTNIDLYPIHDPYASIVHRANQNSIKGVMVSGRFVDGSDL